MLSNTVKTFLRHTDKNKGFFVLNFLGLYISVLASLLIALIILYETSFDKPADKGLSIYRVVNHSTSASGTTFNGVTPYPLAAGMRAAMPDEKLIAQVHFMEDGFISLADKKFKEKNIIFADSVFPKLFALDVKEGDLYPALTETGFAVLTESAAKRYFGQEAAVGKRIRLMNYVDLEVAAVVADAPANTHLPYDLLVSYPTLDKHFLGGMPLDEWTLTDAGYTYIGLTDASQVRRTEAILADISEAHIHKADAGFTTVFKLQPLRDIHYDQLYAWSNPSYTIDYRSLYLMGVIGLFLILAACINYTNLSTGLATKKSKEVGVRKTMGATRPQLLKQFLSETFLLTTFVVLAATVSVRPLLPYLNRFLDKNIPLDWLSAGSVLFVLFAWITVSLLSGLYPAFILSGFNPVTALKNRIPAPKSAVALLRRGLVVFQFLTAQVLIIGTIVVIKQMAYIQSQPLGFDKQNVLDISLPGNKSTELEALRNRLSAIPGVGSVSFSVGAPVSDNQVNTGFNLKEKVAAEYLNVSVKSADKNYLQTYGLQMAAGRWFDENDESRTDRAIPDSLRRYAFVLNETAVKTLGFASPQAVLGKYVTFGINNITAPVIGVIKDYHITSVHKPVGPVLMVQFPFFYSNAGIRLSGGIAPSVLQAIEKAYTFVYPNDLFESSFLDAHIASLYKEEVRTQKLFDIFTFLSIVINVLGLIGLLSFMIEQKTKEIGIRKVLGASVRDISLLLSKDFVRLILIAFLIAAPVAWFVMNKWLEEFAYRTSINWWVFAVTLAGALIITGIAIGFQTIKAAVANPVRNLRSE